MSADNTTITVELLKSRTFWSAVFMFLVFMASMIWKVTIGEDAVNAAVNQAVNIGTAIAEFIGLIAVSVFRLKATAEK